MFLLFYLFLSKKFYIFAGECIKIKIIYRPKDKTNIRLFRSRLTFISK